MTYDEMIAVIQAAKEGKKIQCRRVDDNTNRWDDTLMPDWNFWDFDYRVKPEPTRPYANAEEFLAAMKEHGPYLRSTLCGVFFLANHVNGTGALVEGFDCDYKEMYNSYKWQDGHPCGIEK